MQVGGKGYMKGSDAKNNNTCISINQSEIGMCTAEIVHNCAHLRTYLFLHINPSYKNECTFDKTRINWQNMFTDCNITISMVGHFKLFFHYRSLESRLGLKMSIQINTTKIMLSTPKHWIHTLHTFFTYTTCGVEELFP